ncbi:hypothetical protein J1605_014624 [Eschrichtius robustus]|uniref:Uncharacterized protein n=1 Tax=Eschrichtius robustus TaxID=9764 RepID=A0AB34GC21_ESCRO|nr:hypothetical protein J1605_014624 [Eschrichtius robustus]
MGLRPPCLGFVVRVRSDTQGKLGAWNEAPITSVALSAVTWEQPGFGRNRLRSPSLEVREERRSPPGAAAPRGEGGPAGLGGASRGRGGGAASSSSSSPPPPQGPRRNLGSRGAHSPRRAAGLAAAAATETHPRRVPVSLPAPPGRSARAPSARSLALLPCGRLRHGVGVGGAGGGGAGLRQPVPAGLLSGPACGQLDAAAWQAALGLGGPGGPRARIRGGRELGLSLRHPGRDSGGGKTSAPQCFSHFPWRAGPRVGTRDPPEASTGGHSVFLFPP